MLNILRLSQEKRVYSQKRKEFGVRLLRGLEQKNTAWMKKIVQKLTNTGNLVWDACAGTASIAKAFIFLPKHRKFLECEV